MQLCNIPLVTVLLRSVTRVNMETGVRRATEANLASRARLAQPDHGACRVTGVLLESEALRDLQ